MMFFHQESIVFERINRKLLFAAAGVALAIVVTLLSMFWFAPNSVSPRHCYAWDYECYRNQMSAGLGNVSGTIRNWSWFNLIGQVLIVVLSIAATLAIALLNDKNKEWTKPVGLVSTALVAGLTSALITLQVSEKIDSLVVHLGKLAEAANEFDHAYRAAADGIEKEPEEMYKKYKTDPAFREKLQKDIKGKLAEYNKLRVEVMKLGGTASKFRALSAPQPQ
jgi:hypothetical protein